MGKHTRAREAPSSGRPPARVGRRTVLAALGVVPVLVVGGTALRTSDRAGSPAAPRPLVAPMVRGTRYFVSPDGHDDASGTDARTPWRTIEGVNRRMADGTI